MKQTLILIAMSAIFMSYLRAQECSVTAVGISYIVPKGASVDIMKSGKFQAGIGLTYNTLTTKEKGEMGWNYELSILTYGGVRVYHVEYRTAIYTNGGISFSQLYGPKPYFGIKYMLLRNQKALFGETYYCRKPGVKLGVYILV